MTTMTREMDWQAQAACRGISRDIFFPEEFSLPNPAALRLCNGSKTRPPCPVKGTCLQWALDYDEVGIWGGMTDDGRDKIKKTLHRVKCPDCQSYNVVAETRCEICLNCGLSWQI